MSTRKESFNIVGIEVRTNNSDGSSQKDIPNLWNKFISEELAGKIKNKLSEEVYCVYTDYAGDHTEEYSTIIGCRVSNLDEIPENFKGINIEAANYSKFCTKGNLMQGVVWEAWSKIWKSTLDRTYKSDFEVYGAKAQNPVDAEVDIFVSVK